jgi:hypothetical protein
MPRTPDKPGTFRVKATTDGRYRLTGVRLDGSRVNLRANTRNEAEGLSRTLFPPPPQIPQASVAGSFVAKPPEQLNGPDDWGNIPLRVSQQTVASVAAASGIVPPPPPTNAPSIVADAEAKLKGEKDKEARLKRAKSLAELLGVGYSAGVVYTARKQLAKRDYDVPRSNIKQNNMLADEFRDAITETFGDREVGSWTMVLLLTLGIPLSLWLQAEKKKPAQLPNGQQPNLRTVP